MPVAVRHGLLEHVQAVSVGHQQTDEARERVVVLLDRGEVEFDRASGICTRPIRDAQRRAVDRDRPSWTALVDDGSQPREPTEIGSPSSNREYGNPRAM